MRFPIYGIVSSALLLASVTLPTSVYAQMSKEWKSCTGKPDIAWATQITNCTALIGSRNESQHFRSMAYYNRGLAWFNIKNYDRAIADFSEVIRLNPQYADAYAKRGYVWESKGNHDRAIADFSEAIRLNPKDAAAYFNRGYAWHRKGDYDHAIADYTEATQLNPRDASGYFNRGRLFYYSGSFEKAATDFLRVNDLTEYAYGMLWRYLARGRLGQDGTAELAANAVRLKTKDWPYAIIDFYLARRSLDEMRASASNPNARCEAAFYTGAWQLLHGNNAEAKTSMQVAADTCPKTFVEYEAAVVGLKQINR